MINLIAINNYGICSATQQNEDTGFYTLPQVG
jgi:hypothetical protein